MATSGGEISIDLACEGIEAILAIVVAHPSGSGTTERHGLDEQVNVHQIHAASTKGQLADEPVDGFLIAAEDKAGEPTSPFPHPRHLPPPDLLSHNLQHGSEDPGPHDLVIPGGGIQKRGIGVVRIAV